MAFEHSLAPPADTPAHRWRAALNSARQSLGAIPARPGLDLTRTQYRLAALAVIVCGFALQALLVRGGLFSISADESARAILAHGLSWANAFEPAFWTPFNKIANGLALRIHNDLFITPRVLNALFGFGTLAAVAALARRLFDNRLVAVLSGLLLVAQPQHMILSVAPLSDMSAYFLTVLAAVFLAGWLRHDSTRDLVAAAALLLLASMVRFESWFLNALLGLYAAYRALIRRDLPLAPFLVCGILLGAFPLFWIVNTYLHDGSLARFGVTSMQFVAAHGHDYAAALKSNALVLFVKDVLTAPAALFGALGLGAALMKSRALASFAALLFAPLFILAALMIASFSVPLAAPFRIDGVWLFLLMPFAAWAIVSLADHLRAGVSCRLAAVAVLAYLCASAGVLEAHKILHDYRKPESGLMTREDLALGGALKSALKSDTRNVLLDAIDNLDFLNVIVAANAPDRMILNVDAEPVATGLYARRRQHYIANGPATVVDTYLTDRFNIAGGLDARQLAERRIGFVVLRNGDFIAAAGKSPLLEKMGAYGAWVLYRVKQGR